MITLAARECGQNSESSGVLRSSNGDFGAVAPAEVSCDNALGMILKKEICRSALTYWHHVVPSNSSLRGPRLWSRSSSKRIPSAFSRYLSRVLVGHSLSDHNWNSHPSLDYSEQE